MSSAVFAALPATASVFQYDADGDAIMTDAATGLPVRFSGHVRARSESSDDDTVDTRPSKRSRSSSDEDGGAAAPSPRRGSTGTLIASPLPAVAAPAPSAPKKASVGPRDVDDEDGDGAESAARNLAEAMANVVLDGEPRDGAANPAPEPSAPPAGEPADGYEFPEEEGWCIGLRCRDLALRLDMRHPRVVLNLLRFVDSYNELAPPGEDIHLPEIPREQVELILGHEGVVNVVPEFAHEVAELRSLVQRYSCLCSDCYPQEYHRDYDSDDSDDSEEYRRRRRAAERRYRRDDC